MTHYKNDQSVPTIDNTATASELVESLRKRRDELQKEVSIEKNHLHEIKTLNLLLGSLEEKTDMFYNAKERLDVLTELTSDFAEKEKELNNLNKTLNSVDLQTPKKRS